MTSVNQSRKTIYKACPRRMHTRRHCTKNRFSKLRYEFCPRQSLCFSRCSRICSKNPGGSVTENRWSPNLMSGRYHAKQIRERYEVVQLLVKIIAIISFIHNTILFLYHHIRTIHLHKSKSNPNVSVIEKLSSLHRIWNNFQHSDHSKFIWYPSKFPLL